MDEYIEREALIEWLKRIPLIDLSDGRGLCRVIMEDDFKKAIKKMPKGIVEDVAPVRHGRCKKSDGKDEWYTYYYTCVECGANMMVADADYHDVSPNYCPACGARMDLEEV